MNALTIATLAALPLCWEIPAGGTLPTMTAVNASAVTTTTDQPLASFTTGATCTIDLSVSAPGLTHLWVPSAKVLMTKPIPVLVEKSEHNDFIATFAEAGLSMSGDTPQEAMTLLAAYITSVFARYKKETSLGPWAVKQLAALEKYLGEKVEPA